MQTPLAWVGSNMCSWRPRAPSTRPSGPKPSAGAAPAGKSSVVAGDHTASRLGLLSVSSPSLTSPYTTLVALGLRESGGRAPGGADAVNERSLSARWRNEAEVSVLWASLRSSPLPPALSNGSLLSLLLAMLHGENLTGRSGPATDTTDDMEEELLVKAGRKPGGGDARGARGSGGP